MSLHTRAGRLAALAAFALLPSLAAAQDVTAGDLVIQHPWSRATPGGAQIAGGYLTVVNKGKAPDRLVGGSLQAAAGFELHAMSMDDGVMRMRPTGPLTIPPGGQLMLDPAAIHIMFTGLKRPLRKGETVDGTLVFDHAGTVPVRFDVEGIGARKPSAGHGEQSMPGLDVK